ncbi:MAG: 30S ribosomal protein S4 [bacterium]|nr:30S ribosomal protein S4 [bacterium]
MPLDSKCKVCRRQGVKLFLRGERCFSPKCAMIKRPTPPGIKRKRRRGSLSEYGKELREKQKLKAWYGLGERQFKKYVKEILNKTKRIQKEKEEDATQLLIKRLESRLDSVVFRMGIVSSRALARQLVSHGYFRVNGRHVDIPSYRVKKDDQISIKPQKTKKKIFQNAVQFIKGQKSPEWLQVNPQTLEAKILSDPILDVESLPAEIPAIFEFYSR